MPKNRKKGASEKDPLLRSVTTGSTSINDEDVSSYSQSVGSTDDTIAVTSLNYYNNNNNNNVATSSSAAAPVDIEKQVSSSSYSNSNNSTAPRSNLKFLPQPRGDDIDSDDEEMEALYNNNKNSDHASQTYGVSSSFNTTTTTNNNNSNNNSNYNSNNSINNLNNNRSRTSSAHEHDSGHEVFSSGTADNNSNNNNNNNNATTTTNNKNNSGRVSTSSSSNNIPTMTVSKSTNHSRERSNSSLASSPSPTLLGLTNPIILGSGNYPLRSAKSTHGSSTSLNTLGSGIVPSSSTGTLNASSLNTTTNPNNTSSMNSNNNNNNNNNNALGSSKSQLNTSTISTSSERRPLKYTPPSSPSQASAIYSRYKYYSRLAPSEPDTMRIPNHILPPSLFILRPTLSSKPIAPKSQSSLITILSIWNTMIGTSMLAMPWAIQQSGFTLGILCMVFMGIITLYTCTLVLRHGNGGFGPKGEEIELPEVCRMYLGKKGYYVSIIFALITFVGAQIVYWVLMSNFLYATVEFAHNPNQNDTASASDDDSWSSYWNTTYSPLFLVLLLFPLVNFKSLTFFTKFNSFGVISIAYIIFFVIYKAADSGIHFDSNVKQFDGHFISLVGVLTLSFFMHNGSLSIVRNNKNPENNVRDLSIAYCLVGLTYAVVGITFFISFDGDKSLIESNLLDNFHKNDVLALVARVFLLFQMITVFPLLMFIVRFQFMNMIYGNSYPSFFKVFSLNLVICGICVLVAVVYPNIGDIIRFTGAISGLALVFALPCLIHLTALRRKGELKYHHIIIHGSLIVIGVANLIGQFAVL